MELVRVSLSFPAAPKNTEILENTEPFGSLDISQIVLHGMKLSRVEKKQYYLGTKIKLLSVLSFKAY